MKWTQKGLLFRPGNSFNWMNSHAQVPTLLKKEDRLRVYFSSRPQKNLSLTTFVDLDLNDLSKILYLNPEPILALGEPGTFDEHGIMPSSVLEVDGRVYLYYSGWSRKVNVPYSNFTGLAISEDGGHTFKKYSENPILHPTKPEPFSATSPCVLWHEDVWHMWYCSGVDWLEIDNKLEHTYDIKYAFSQDGFHWTQTGQSAVMQQSRYEAITRPTVIELEGLFHMWYCYRGSLDFRNGKDSYRIGYAISQDLVNWTRKDDCVGIEVSASGWDSKMMAYPSVTELQKQLVMFYNGNDFGAEGFGYALRQQ